MTDTLILIIIVVLLIIFFIANPHILNILFYKVKEKKRTKSSQYSIVKATKPSPLPQAQAYPYPVEEETAKKFRESQTLAFLVIKDGHILTEQYYQSEPSKKILSFSAAKSIIAILIGIALDKGMLESLTQKIAPFFPQLRLAPDITIRDLLTMSSGLKWSEKFLNPFSDVVRAFYSDDLWRIVKRTKSIYPTGKQFSYKCINTILLGLILEKVSQIPVNQFTQKYLWEPMGAEYDALWAKDKKDIQKTFCCIYATARDYAKVGLILLNNGYYNGKQIVSEHYVRQMLSPATYLTDKFGKQVDYYGFQTWIMHYNGMTIPYFRGMFGQYVFILPQKNAIIVRLGERHTLPTMNQDPTDAELYIKAGLQAIEQNKGG